MQVSFASCEHWEALQRTGLPCKTFGFQKTSLTGKGKLYKSMQT
jgi:hypothetical protein